MKKLLKFFSYVFWKIVYCFRTEPKRFDDLILKLIRTRSPFWKFKPYVFRNEHGKMWDICFSNERDYTETRQISVRVNIGMDSGDIVGLQIYDEVLKNRDEK